MADPGKPNTSTRSWMQIVRDADKDFDLESRRPIAYEFSNGRKFRAPANTYGVSPVAPDSVIVVTPGSGDTVVLIGWNPIYVNNPAALGNLTIRLPPLADPIPTQALEISFRQPVTELSVIDHQSGVLPHGGPTSAYGPGAGLTLRYVGNSNVGWIYWK